MTTNDGVVKTTDESRDSEPLYHDTRRSAASIADRCNPLLTWLQTVEEVGDDSCSRHSAQKGECL